MVKTSSHYSLYYCMLHENSILFPDPHPMFCLLQYENCKTEMC